MRSIYSLLTFFLLSILISAAASAQPTASQAAAEKYAKAIAEFSVSGDRAGYAKFVEANFNAELLKSPMQRHVNFLSTIHDMSRGYDLDRVQDWNPNEVIYLAKNRLTGVWDALLVRVEPEAPYKISGIGLRPPKSAPAETKAMSPREMASELEAFGKKLSDADVFSGAILLARNGEIVYKGAFGQANKDFNAPNRVDTKFNLGSMNKMFTAVAIAQLVEKGKISFDDPLSKFIPDFPNAEAAKKIQIKHLLSHTAGLGGYFGPRYDGMSRAKLRTVDDMLKLAREDEKDIAFEPGSRWRYSNTGMMVLGKVIEVASGQSYFDYVRENIHKPAGMINTDCYELDKVNRNLAVGYDKQFGDAGITWSNNIFAHVMRGGPQGGGYSTVEDLLRFDQALRQGKLISTAMFKTLASPKPELNSPDYGYGFGVDPAKGIVGHSGGFPGISSNLDIYTESGWTAIVMSNYSRGAEPFIQKMNAMIAASK